MGVFYLKFKRRLNAIRLARALMSGFAAAFLLSGIWLILSKMTVIDFEPITALYVGTGGLVRAYTAAAIGALESAEIIRYDIYSTLEISVNYSDYGKITAILAERGFRTEDTAYDTGVSLTGSIVKTELDSLISAITDATAGRAEINVIGEEFSY